MGEIVLAFLDMATDDCLEAVCRYVTRIRGDGPLAQQLRAAGYQPRERPAQLWLRRTSEAWATLQERYQALVPKQAEPDEHSP